MKRILFILTLALVALAGCKKDPAPGQTPDTPTTIGSLLGEWSGKEYHGVTIVQGGSENSITINNFPDQNKSGLQGYVMSDNTIRIPKQKIKAVYYEEGETIILKDDFIPLNGDELVILFDSDHIYISDSWELGYYIIDRYFTRKGKADILIRKQ